MERFGLQGAYSLIYHGGERFIGLSREGLLERISRSALLLNVMGFLQDPELLAYASRRVFLDIDPGFGQMWQALGLHNIFQGHDQYVTIGRNIGRTDCAIPDCDLDWITTPQPIVLDYWPVRSACGSGKFTSICSWRGPYGPLEYQGKTYGLRVHEFRKFAPLPRLSERPFELALDIHPADDKDQVLLAANGWTVVDPKKVASDPGSYQAYVQGSKAEFMVAKGMYVQTNSGWFSDRSICYLASGKPVLAQDTGLQPHYPVGEGLLVFRTLDEALAGIEELERNYARHAGAARALAEEYFDSDRVLNRLLGKLGVG